MGFVSTLEDSSISLTGRSYPTISVIVPVHNGGEHTSALVESFGSQTYPKDLFEVILIDNLSTDGAASCANDRLKRAGVASRLLEYSDRASSYAARNLGASATHGDLLVFTDFDCAPNVDWLMNIASDVALGKIVAGQVELEIQDPRNHWEHLDSTSHMRNDLAKVSARLATANMAATRRDFELVGPFLEVQSGGDFEWSRRAQAAGMEISYCPQALVRHPTRKTYGEIRNKLLRISRGAGEMAHENWRRRVTGLISCLARLPLLPMNARVPVIQLQTYVVFRLKFFGIRMAQLGEFIRAAFFRGRRRN